MQQTVLVTGASSGIGRALAQEFASHGYDLVLVARNREGLQDLARTLSGPPRGTAAAVPALGGPRRSLPGGPDTTGATQVRIVPADLAQPNSGRFLVEQLHDAGIHVDVVVNNAGFGLQGEFAALDVRQQLEMVQLNVTTLTELTRLLLPAMLSRRTGGVLNVASTAAFQPGPLMSVYYATKAYVLSFTEGIAEEVAGTGLKVSCLCPGPTATGFAARAEASGTNLFARRSVMPAGDVAREGFTGWNSGRVVVVPGFGNRQGTFIVRLAPRAVIRRIVKGLNSQAG